MTYPVPSVYADLVIYLELERLLKCSNEHITKSLYGHIAMPAEYLNTCSNEQLFN